MFFSGENHRWISVRETVKSHLALLNRFPPFLSDMSFAKTFILRQRLNSSAARLRYRICSTPSSGWFSQLTLTDPFALVPISLGVSPPSCPSSCTRGAFLNHAFVVNFSSRMNQCFHFSIITAMAARSGAPSIHAGCKKSGFLIAQARKHRDIFFFLKRRMSCLLFFSVSVTKRVGRLC